MDKITNKCYYMGRRKIGHFRNWFKRLKAILYVTKAFWKPLLRKPLKVEHQLQKIEEINSNGEWPQSKLRIVILIIIMFLSAKLKSSPISQSVPDNVLPDVIDTAWYFRLQKRCLHGIFMVIDGSKRFNTNEVGFQRLRPRGFYIRNPKQQRRFFSVRNQKEDRSERSRYI